MFRCFLRLSYIFIFIFNIILTKDESNIFNNKLNNNKSKNFFSFLEELENIENSEDIKKYNNLLEIQKELKKIIFIENNNNKEYIRDKFEKNKAEINKIEKEINTIKSKDIYKKYLELKEKKIDTYSLCGVITGVLILFFYDFFKKIEE